MQKLSAIIACLLFMGNTTAQTFKKHAIGKSGCSAYFPTDTITFQYNKGDNDIYSGQCSSGDTTYGVICMKLDVPAMTLKDGEVELAGYLDILKEDFGIVKASGYKKGLRLNEKGLVKGISDSWTDKEGEKSRIRAWTDGNYIVVVYMFGKYLPSENLAFLNGVDIPKEVKKPLFEKKAHVD